MHSCKVTGTQRLEFFWQSHSQPFKGSEILGLDQMLRKHLLGVVSPLPTALCTLGLGEPTQALVFPPPGPQLSLHLQPSPLFRNAGVDSQRPAGPLRPDSSQAGPEAALVFLTSAFPDITPRAAGPTPLETQASSSFSLLHPSQSDSNSVAQPPQS